MLWLHEATEWPSTLSPDAALQVLHRRLSTRPDGEVHVPAQLNHPLVQAFCATRKKPQSARTAKRRLRSTYDQTLLYYLRLFLIWAALTLVRMPRDFTAIDLRQITLDDLEDYWGFLQREVRQGRRQRTSVVLQFKYLSMWLDWAVQEGHIARNPLRRWPIEAARQQQLDLPSDTAMLRFHREVAASVTAACDRALFGMAEGSGLRPGKLLDARLGDLRLGEHALRVVGKGGKERLVPIPDAVVERLRDYLAVRPEGSPYLFLKEDGRPMTYGELLRRFHRYGEAAQLGWPRGPHVLRHLCATRLVDAGVDVHTVAQLLGHAGVGITQTYIHVNRKALRRKLSGIFAPLDPDRKK